MARITKPLTNTEIKQAKPKDKDYPLSDGHGLQLRVKSNGSKLWLFNYYRPYTKKRANLSLGRYPDVTLAQARVKTKEARELVAQDIDPQAHKQEVNSKQQEAISNTFGVVANKWLLLKREQVKTETAEKAWSTLNKHVLPGLANIPVNQIKPKTILSILNPVAAKGSLETVKRLCRNINEVMRLAVALGLIEVNYLTDITKTFPAPKKSNMPTIKPEQLPELMASLRDANLMRTTRHLVAWQLHTMTRPTEAVTAKWADIDLDKKIWVIPAERMKMGKAHTIPLTPQVIVILENLRAMNGQREYIFAGHKNPSTHASESGVNMALKRMGFKGRLVAHGMRSLASTTLNEQGFDPDVIEAALSHVDKNEIRRAYNHAEYIERRRIMMGWWSDRIEEASTGQLATTESNIAQFKAVNS